MAVDIKDFDKSLEAFKRATTSSMKFARECSEMALEHFIEHGQVALLQRFYDACPKDFIRKKALVQWAIDHAPLTMEKDKFIKDKSKDAVEANLKAAKAKPFWEYSPDPQQVFFGESDVVTSLEKAVKRFEGERYKAKDDKATQRLHAAKVAIEQLKHNTTTSNVSEAKRPAA